MLQVEMSANLRETTGKGPMRRLRIQGITPAVVYGAGVDTVNVQLETKPMTSKLLEIVRRNAVVTLKIEGVGEKSVVVKEIQTDPIRDTLMHADFCEIDLQKEATFTVPLRFEGVAKGVDLGGALETYASDVLLKGKPLDIPDEVTLDVQPLAIGDKLSFSAIALPENVTMVTEAEAVCVGVVKL